AVLQIRAEDAPPPVKFRPGADLLQVLWSPRDPKDGELPVAVRWRKRADVTGPTAEPPATDRAFMGYVPVPCRVFPERVIGCRDWDTLSKTALRAKVEAWKLPAKLEELKLSGPEFYSRFLSSARGTKVGGYPRWPTGKAVPPGCPTCKWGMDYLLTVDSAEWGAHDSLRWKPIEETHPGEGASRAAGFGFAGNVQVFVCRRCDEWPARAVV